METKVTVADLQKMVKEFVDERDWNQFHSPKNLSMNMAVEVAELMELLLWQDGPQSYAEVEKQREKVEDELADVLMTVLCFANATSIDVVAAFLKKLEKIKQKYPVALCKGKSGKYTTYLECKNKTG